MKSRTQPSRARLRRAVVVGRTITNNDFFDPYNSLTRSTAYRSTCTARSGLGRVVVGVVGD